MKGAYAFLEVATETPLVVVPAEHLRHPPGCLGKAGDEYLRREIADDVGGDHGVGGVARPCGERFLGGELARMRIDLRGGDLAVVRNGEIHQ